MTRVNGVPVGLPRLGHASEAGPKRSQRRERGRVTGRRPAQVAALSTRSVAAVLAHPAQRRPSLDRTQVHCAPHGPSGA
ncbi:hypothetical protein [Streptomyces sp. RKAG293]|uniref:hypothetical protein n=1 Tax=Streptomyces sp. RKAG293 TaxID=2893403 RepID=UPI00203448BE|nr:hypothetical protein [Streptomyces sp. RKAG293]MCM2422642.1 hypothetical protein [Streptomyces sp. RKAG293]